MIHVVLIIVIVAIALALLWVVRRYFGYDTLTDANPVSGMFAGIIGALNGIMIAFLISTVWTDYQQAEETITREAIATVTLRRLATALPSDAAAVLSRHTQEYARSVIDDEWPSMRERKESPATRQALERMWLATLRIEPRSPREQVLVSQIVAELREVRHARRSRLLACTRTLPALLWWVVFAGATATVISTFFLGVRSLAIHAVQSALLVTTLSIALMTLVDLRQPFSGRVRIDARAFVQALQLMQNDAIPTR